MSERLRESFTPPAGKDFIPYMRNSFLPPLRAERLGMDMYLGQEREPIRVPVTGDMSLVINYKKKPGIVSSYGTAQEELSVLQLQGVKFGEGYRINTGLVWVHFFADQIVQLAHHPLSGVRRITMPPNFAIDGFVDATERAMKKYHEFAARARLSFSKEEQIWVRDIK